MNRITLIILTVSVVCAGFILLMANSSKSSVEYLIGVDYQLSEVKIWGQGREAICKNKEAVGFFENLLRHKNFGNGPGLPDEAGSRSFPYYIKFSFSNRQCIRVTIIFDENRRLFSLMDGAVLWSDPDYYWFKLPKERPVDFEQLLKFLLNDDNRGESLEI